MRVISPRRSSTSAAGSGSLYGTSTSTTAGTSSSGVGGGGLSSTTSSSVTSNGGLGGYSKYSTYYDRASSLSKVLSPSTSGYSSSASNYLSPSTYSASSYTPRTSAHRSSLSSASSTAASSYLSGGASSGLGTSSYLRPSSYLSSSGYDSSTLSRYGLPRKTKSNTATGTTSTSSTTSSSENTRNEARKPPTASSGRTSSASALNGGGESNYNSSSNSNRNSLKRLSGSCSSSSLARLVATSGLDIYEKYSPATYKPNTELSRSRSTGGGGSGSANESSSTSNDKDGTTSNSNNTTTSNGNSNNNVSTTCTVTLDRPRSNSNRYSRLYNNDNDITNITNTSLDRERDRNRDHNSSNIEATSSSRLTRNRNSGKFSLSNSGSSGDIPTATFTLRSSRLRRREQQEDADKDADAAATISSSSSSSYKRLTNGLLDNDRTPTGSSISNGIDSHLNGLKLTSSTSSLHSNSGGDKESNKTDTTDYIKTSDVGGGDSGSGGNNDISTTAVIKLDNNENNSSSPTTRRRNNSKEECELAHAQVAGGCIQIKKHQQQQQQQYNESLKKRVVDEYDDSKNNNNNNYNFNSKPSGVAAINRSEQKPSYSNVATNATITNNSNSSKSLHGNNSLSARSVGAETFNVMRMVTPDGSHQTTVGTTISAAGPATGNNLAYKYNKTNLSSPTTIATSTVNTNTAAKATPKTAAASTGPSSAKSGAGYLRLQHVQNTRVFYPSSSNKTGSASSRHLQNTSHRSFSSSGTSASGVVRAAAGGISTALGTGTGKYFNYNTTNNNIVGTNNTTTSATGPRLVPTSTITNNNNIRNRSMGSNNNYMNYRHLYGSNNNDQNKQQQQQHQEQMPQQLQQQKQHERERERDQLDDITFIDSEEITPTNAVSPDITVGSVNAQTMQTSLNDKPPIYFKPITPPFQHRVLSHTERGTQRARPKSTIILPTTSRASSATAYGSVGGAGIIGSSYTFERVNNYKYTNGSFYVNSKGGGGGGGTGSSRNTSGSGVVTIPQQQQREQFAKAAAGAVLNACEPTTTAAADNIDTLGIKNSIEKFNSLSDQKNQRPTGASNSATISTNNIATATFTANTVGGGSNAVENITTSRGDGGGGGGSSTNLQQRYYPEVEHQSASINSRLGAGYSHSLTRGTHRNNSGGNSSHGNFSGRRGFAAGASHNSRTSSSSASSPMVVTNKNMVAGIHHSARPAAAAAAATTSSVLPINAPRPRLGFANNSNTNSNSYSNERSTMRALNSIENISSGGARPMPTMTFESTAATVNGSKSVTNSSFLTTNNKLTQEQQHQQHKQQKQYNNDNSVIIRYNSSSNSNSNSNKISTGTECGSQIPTSISSSSSISSNSSSNVGGVSIPTPTPETSNANAAAVSNNISNNSTSSSGTAVVTSTQVAVVIANESVRNARTILPTVSPTTTATQRYWERENSGIRGSHAMPSSTVTSASLATSKYSSAINDTNKLSNGRDAACEGLCGLRNIGNTCFMNSVIQCLSHTTELTRFLRAHQGSRSAATKDQQILYEFAKLIQEMWTADVHSVTPMELKRAFSTKHRMYSDFNQQDAQEFLRFFLDSLHSALNTGVKNEPLNIDDNLSDNKKADLTWEWYVRHENSLIRDLFVGQLKSTLKCTTCGNTSVTFDPFWDLSVSLPSSSRCKLEACLDLFIREEVLDGDEMPTCSKCKTRRKCTKSFTIQRFPKYLVIHLKRFSETRWSKLSNIVEFPTGDRELNMGPYAANLSSSVQYSLYAVSNHMGSTAGGHYVALCKHPVSRKWHEFNDNIVSDPIIESHLVSSCAYILFYERA